MALTRHLLRLSMLACVAAPTIVWGAEAFPVITDPNDDGLSFDVGAANAFVDGQYGLDVAGPFAVYNQNFSGPCCSGAGISASVSNGENGITESFDGTDNMDLNEDIDNVVAANSVFSTIGNASGRLENGNVLRFSAWFKSDPENPIDQDPQIQPVLKFELWKEALSGNQDTNGGASPSFGDKVFDQDINGAASGLLPVDLPQWIDLDGDGAVIDGSAAGQGRVSSINTTDWTLVETEYTVDDTFWAIGDDFYTVADIEEIRGVMFMGDFTGADLTGDGDGGNLLVDNLLIEVFADAASVTPNMNPVPDNTVMENFPGDANGDGTVDLLDLDILGSNFGTMGGATFADGDFNEDGNVDLLDLDILGGNFGNSVGMAAAVPEPTSGVIVALAGLMAVARSRRS